MSQHVARSLFSTVVGRVLETIVDSDAPVDSSSGASVFLRVVPLATKLTIVASHYRLLGNHRRASPHCITRLAGLQSENVWRILRLARLRRRAAVLASPPQMRARGQAAILHCKPLAQRFIQAIRVDPT